MEDDIDILLLLADYKMDFVAPSYIFRDRKQLEKCSTYCWAVDELENYILSHVDEEPIDACMMFIRQMSFYRRCRRGGRVMCDAAIEVANDIMDILVCAKGELNYE